MTEVNCVNHQVLLDGTVADAKTFEKNQDYQCLTSSFEIEEQDAGRQSQIINLTNTSDLILKQTTASNEAILAMYIDMHLDEEQCASDLATLVGQHKFPTFFQSRRISPNKAILTSVQLEVNNGRVLRNILGDGHSLFEDGWILKLTTSESNFEIWTPRERHATYYFIKDNSLRFRAVNSGIIFGLRMLYLVFRSTRLRDFVRQNAAAYFCDTRKVKPLNIFSIDYNGTHVPIFDDEEDQPDLDHLSNVEFVEIKTRLYQANYDMRNNTTAAELRIPY